MYVTICFVTFQRNVSPEYDRFPVCHTESVGEDAGASSHIAAVSRHGTQLQSHTGLSCQTSRYSSSVLACFSNNAFEEELLYSETLPYKATPELTSHN